MCALRTPQLPTLNFTLSTRQIYLPDKLQFEFLDMGICLCYNFKDNLIIRCVAGVAKNPIC